MRFTAALCAMLCSCGFAVAGFDDEQLREDHGQAAAVALVNEYRDRAGLSPLAADEAIHLAAGRHGAYLLENAGRLRGNADYLLAHDEVPWWPGYVAETPGDRALIAGFDAAWPGDEIVHFLGEPVAAVESWVDTVYHRIAMLTPNTTHCGHASLRTDAGVVDVMDFAQDLGWDGDTVALWPVPDATGVRAAWYGFEAPQPKAPPAGYPSGYPISAVFGGDRAVDVVLEASAVSIGGAEQAHIALDPGNDPLMWGAVFVYTEAPLPEFSWIDVALRGTAGGVPFELAWSFQTACVDVCVVP